MYCFTLNTNRQGVCCFILYIFGKSKFKIVLKLLNAHENQLKSF